MIRIERWWVSMADLSAYSAPELKVPCLAGNVYGHPRFDEGDKVRTSPITETYYKKVKTAAGTEYTLGEPHPDYVKWCADNNITIDPEWPIKVRTPNNLN